MRIIVYGQSFREGMPASLAAAFERTGHEVRIFDYTRELFYTRLRSRYAHILDRALFRYVVERINSGLRLLLAEWKPELLVVCGGRHVLPETLAWAARLGVSAASWEYDEPFNKGYITPFIAQALREYGIVFTPRRHLIEEYRARGAREVCHLPFCFDPAVLYPVPLTDADRKLFATDIGFVGAWSRRRESFLSKLTEFSVKVWGPSWRHAARGFRNHERITVTGKIVRGPDMSRALRASAIAVNFLTLEQRDRINVRTFEIPACGAFQICERSDEVLSVLDEGSEVVCYDSLDELRDKCRYYFERPESRKAIAEAAHRRILSGGHTYADRAGVILRYAGRPIPGQKFVAAGTGAGKR